MKFKGAVILSIFLHVSLFALAIYFPRTEMSNETTYYVDLVSFSGSGGGGRGSTPPPALKKEAAKEGDTTPQNTLRMKDLTVKKESQSTMRYPKKNSSKNAKTSKKKAKKKEPQRQEIISVVRKPRRNSATAKKNADSRKSGTSQVNLKRKGVSLGAGSGSGYGTGSGSGFGRGMGGSGASSPYAYYYDQIIQEVSSSWYSSLVSPGLKGKFITTVYFKIYRNGEVKEIKIERKSGIRSLDMSARRAVENAAPFPQLPADYPYQYLIVHFDFTWEK
jgi:protein TonB